MPANRLAKIENESNRILRSAGISVVWFDAALPGAPDLPPNSFILRVRSGPVAAPVHITRREILGRAFLPGIFADVYYDAVRKVATDFGCDREINTILAYVIAHELGHLLLGPAHSAIGVMRASWSREDTERMSRHELLFSESERQQIQSAPPFKARVSQTASLLSPPESSTR